MPQTVRRPDMYASRKRAMGEMNVTPFIDVLLVLLIMLMLAVPMAKHSTVVDLPGPPGELGIANTDFNSVFIDDADQLFWNGAPVSREQLRANLRAASAMPEDPTLRFEPAALASYDTSAKTIALIKDSGAEKFAFVGNHEHGSFGR
ncbi:MAG: biopolymer transporter ExbD [Pseudomonadota bacterium]